LNRSNIKCFLRFEDLQAEWVLTLHRVRRIIPGMPHPLRVLLFALIATNVSTLDASVIYDFKGEIEGPVNFIYTSPTGFITSATDVHATMLDPHCRFDFTCNFIDSVDFNDTPKVKAFYDGLDVGTSDTILISEGPDHLLWLFPSGALSAAGTYFTEPTYFTGPTFLVTGGFATLTVSRDIQPTPEPQTATLIATAVLFVASLRFTQPRRRVVRDAFLQRLRHARLR